ncbi:hypothetical protein KDX14_17490 [Burkholderia cenocepacia]|uniref:hypothetical protein n=1 Tax=Burkholderia cenocepacia TaxID=95486 RepID=UPI001B9CC8DB|nr:hypothetical protein [Burkholderia cenocepacia]MBR8071301.1 hypothetical protein [Burkholderia cenocepacia]
MNFCFKPVLDKLSVLLPYAAHTEPNEHKRLIEELLTNAEALRTTGTLVKVSNGRRGYLYAYTVEVGNTEHRPILRIGSPRPAECHGAVSFSLTPSKYTPTELSALYRILERIFGDAEQCASMFRRAMLQALHSAIDVPGLELDWLVVDNQRSRNIETYSVAGDKTLPSRITGLYFNQLGSDARTCIYQKDSEQVSRLFQKYKSTKQESEESRIIGLVKTTLNGKPVTRIECRWDKLYALPLHMAHSIPNRFGYLSFRYIDMTKPTPLNPLEARQFIHYVRAVGIAKTLEDYKTLYASQTLYRRAKALWDKSEIKLFNPSQAFNHTIEALKALPFFPAEAFENYNK